MRRQYHIGRMQQRVIGIKGRLLLEHIQTSAGQITTGQGSSQCVAVNHLAAGTVDENGGGLQLLQSGLIDEVCGFFSHRDMQRDDIALAQQRIQIGKANPRHILGGTVIGQHMTAKGLGDGGDTAANGAKTDDAEGLAGQLLPAKSCAAFAAARGLIAGRQIPKQL